MKIHFTATNSGEVRNINYISDIDVIPGNNSYDKSFYYKVDHKLTYYWIDTDIFPRSVYHHSIGEYLDSAIILRRDIKLKELLIYEDKI